MKITFLTLMFLLLFQGLPCFSIIEKVEGLEYEVRKLEDVPIEKVITKRFDLYELYFENRTDKTFSIPGYSVDLGVVYSSLAEVNSSFKDKSQKKLAVFNVAAGAASIAFGGIARTAVGTLRSVGTFNKRRTSLDDNSSYLSPTKTYVLYPGDGLSLFLFVDKSSMQIPNTLRFICKEEDNNLTHIVVNNKIELRELSNEINTDSKEEKYKEDKSNENVIAAPGQEQYR